MGEIFRNEYIELKDKYLEAEKQKRVFENTISELEKIGLDSFNSPVYKLCSDMVESEVPYDFG